MAKTTDKKSGGAKSKAASGSASAAKKTSADVKGAASAASASKTKSEPKKAAAAPAPDKSGTVAGPGSPAVLDKPDSARFKPKPPRNPFQGTKNPRLRDRD